MFSHLLILCVYQSVSNSVSWTLSSFTLVSICFLTGAFKCDFGDCCFTWTVRFPYLGFSLSVFRHFAVWISEYSLWPTGVWERAFKFGLWAIYFTFIVDRVPEAPIPRGWFLLSGFVTLYWDQVVVSVLLSLLRNIFIFFVT